VDTSKHNRTNVAAAAVEDSSHITGATQTSGHRHLVLEQLAILALIDHTHDHHTQYDRNCVDSVGRWDRGCHRHGPEACEEGRKEGGGGFAEPRCS
jgi:hypothetical protein